MIQIADTLPKRYYVQSDEKKLRAEVRLKITF